MDCLEQCRELLRDVTPLREDCGLLCRGACCRSHPGEETGMLLFPGEEKWYENKPGWRVEPAEGGLLLICPGRCARDERPLSCRIFPLLPVLRGGGVRVVTDARSRGTCPLASAGKAGLCAEFTEAVLRCGELLQADAAQEPFLRRLTEIHDQLRALQKQFIGGKSDV